MSIESMTHHVDSRQKQEQTPSHQRLWLERQPNDQQGGSHILPSAQHEEAASEEGLVILDDEG
jgi:hypothetical protein